VIEDFDFLRILKKVEPARSLHDYRVNVSLQIHIMRESNAEKCCNLSTLTGLLK